MVAVVLNKLQSPRMTLQRWLGVSAALGLLAPAVWFSLFFSLGAIPSWGHDLLPRLWPTSLMLLLTSGREHSAQSYLVVTAAILLNVALYSLIGVTCWLLRRAFRASP